MNTQVLQQPQLSTGRLLLLGASSVILCISFIMSVFAPFPIAIAVLLYGRTKGALIGLLGLATTFAFAAFFYKDLSLFGFYVCVLLLGFGIAEILLRGWSPIKGIVGIGLSLITVISISLAVVIKSQNLTAEQFVVKQIKKSSDVIAEKKKQVEESSQSDSMNLAQLLDHPELMAKDVVASFPSLFFIGVFVMLWFNMFLALKSRRLLLAANDYPYSEMNLLNFKVPFYCVLILVVGLVMAVWGPDFGPGYETWGFNIIRCLGIFYFFQGFGVFSDLLSFLGIMGFFRSLIVIVVIFMANYLIAAAGLFDNWFDFRKYFVKRNLE